ncbi:MAG: hypothetical protein JNK82_34865 [Myxococcaceae bacterium]|nr:hypothetical protein [Myxococcaceae bacterium]
MILLPVALALLLAAEAPAPEPAAQPEERLDHRGAIGLIIGLSGMRTDASVQNEGYWRGGLSVGASFNVGWRSNEVIVLACMSMTRTEVLDTTTQERLYGVGVNGHVAGLFRGYFGDQWKTFVDLGAAINFPPGFTAGPRFGVGLQYELNSLAGVFASLGTFIGFGSPALYWRAELMLGVQLRSFLLE